jgi:CubicO group peptidase (beta-lactamase class C family)
MKTNRRSFIRQTGILSAGLGILPALHPLSPAFLPAAGLPRSTPEEQGVDAAQISRFIAAANASGIGWHSFMLLRHGHVVAEGWWSPFESGFTHTLYSLSKSFTSTAVGLLVAEGKLDIEAPVLSFFHEDTPPEASENLKAMKVRHLLTMNTGHSADTMPVMRESAASWTKTFLSQPVTFSPGSHFLYNTGASYMLGAILHAITGKTLAAFLGPRLFEPLGITDYNWELSPQGLNTAGYGLRIKTEDIARFGQLYLQQGQWNGKNPVSAKWVNAATSYQTASQEGTGDWSQGYGYQFWRCKPKDLYRGDGAYGQFCIVMPDQDAVMAVTSESWDMQQSMTTIWENVLPAFKTGKLAPDPAAREQLRSDLDNLLLNIPRGAVTSPLADQYNLKKFSLESNTAGAITMSFNFTGAGCDWIITTAKGDTTYRFGWQKWRLNKASEQYLFPVAGRIHVPSKIAGTATWMDEHTLQLDARFVEAIHGDRITCIFNGDRLGVSFLNSVAANSKGMAELRPRLKGTLTT